MIRKSYKREAGNKGVVVISGSFEANEQLAHRVYFPMPVTITKIRSLVTKALAGTDAGTVTGANSTGASTSGVTTHAASAALGNAQAATPTTNVDVDADDYYQLTTAKSTAGGKVQISLEYKTRG